MLFNSSTLRFSRFLSVFALFALPSCGREDNGGYSNAGGVEGFPTCAVDENRQFTARVQGTLIYDGKLVFSFDHINDPKTCCLNDGSGECCSPCAPDDIGCDGCGGPYECVTGAAGSYETPGLSSADTVEILDRPGAPAETINVWGQCQMVNGLEWCVDDYERPQNPYAVVKVEVFGEHAGIFAFCTTPGRRGCEETLPTESDYVGQIIVTGLSNYCANLTFHVERLRKLVFAAPTSDDKDWGPPTGVLDGEATLPLHWNQ